MALKDDILNKDTIFRHRGDTSAVAYIVQRPDTGAAIDITTYGNFTLTVNVLEEPGASDSPEFSLVGTVTDATNGKVQFSPDTNDADQTSGTYYYDVQAIEPGGGIKTLAKGRWIVRQDVTK